jgi:hypothetical protein
MQSSKDISDARLLAYSLEAQQATESETGLRLSPIPSTAPKAAHTFKQIEFWTGASSAIFGPLRNVFGTVFVKIAGVYQKVRDKFDRLLTKRRKPPGGGLTGSAIRAAFSVMQMVGAHVVRQTIQRLVQSLEDGVTKKLQTLFDPDKIAKIEENIQQIKDLHKSLEEAAKMAVESLVERMIGPYEEVLKKIDNVKDIVSDINTIIKRVRWGARVLACLSPPGWGCLWIVGEAGLDYLAGKVVETCWFQKKITPLISDIPFVKTLPATLADVIVTKIREILPDSLHDVFANIDTSPVAVNKSDIQCNKDDGEDRMTPEREALLDLIETVGEDRYRAFAELSKAMGIRESTTLTVEQIAKIKEAIVKSNVTAQELKEYALLYPNIPKEEMKAKVDGIKRFLNEVKAGPSAAGQEGGQGAGAGKGGAEVTASNEGSEGQQTIVVRPEAKDISIAKEKDYSAEIVSGIGPKDYAGNTVKITIAVKIEGTTVLLEDVKAIVIKRVFKPTQEKPEKIVVHVKAPVTQSVDVSKYPKLRHVGYLKVKKDSTFRYTLSLK